MPKREPVNSALSAPDRRRGFRVLCVTECKIMRITAVKRVFCGKMGLTGQKKSANVDNCTNVGEKPANRPLSPECGGQPAAFFHCTTVWRKTQGVRANYFTKIFTGSGTCPRGAWAMTRIRGDCFHGTDGAYLSRASGSGRQTDEDDLCPHRGVVAGTRSD